MTKSRPSPVATIGLSLPGSPGAADERSSLVALPLCLSQIHELVAQSQIIDPHASWEYSHTKVPLHAFVLDADEVRALSTSDREFVRITAPVYQYQFGYGVLTEAEPAFLRNREPHRMRIWARGSGVTLAFEEPVRSQIEHLGVKSFSVKLPVLMTALWNLGGRTHQQDVLALSKSDHIPARLISGDFGQAYAQRNVPLSLHVTDLLPLLESFRDEVRLAAIQAIGRLEGGC